GAVRASRGLRAGGPRAAVRVHHPQLQRLTRPAGDDAWTCRLWSAVAPATAVESNKSAAELPHSKACGGTT
ncbi:MAG: hypothetical protein WB819_05230, partial [Terriglobia bacterium]